MPDDTKYKDKESVQKLLPGMFPPYLLAVTQDLSSKYLFVGEIAPGKTGIAYKLSDPQGNPYCLKTISPAVTKPEDREQVRNTLRKEVQILSPLNHRCLPSIFERNLTGELPYYICTYHPGQTFIDFKKSGKRFTREKAIYVITSLIDAVEYLHKHGRTHCDLHQQNILISENVIAEGILVIDFGSGHRESDSDGETPDKGHWAFKNAASLGQYRDNVERQEASPEFRKNDIRAFGHALALMTECFFGTAPHDQKIAYKEFCGYLQNGRADNWEIVRERFEYVMDPRALYSRTDRLFIRKSGNREAITLPVSHEVPVGEAVLSVINTKAFQRLRNTKQLSFCDWFYPGGTHTRFEHSLGVFEVTHKAISQLAHDPYFKEQFSQKNIDGALLAGLIHDIGHYPYAHVIEHYLSSRYSLDSNLRKDVHHYYNTLDIIDRDLELNDVVTKYWGEDILTEAKNVLTGKMGVLSQLLDGPIDCDKTDYLRRDSHHCGVKYGDGLDVGEILSSYCCLNNGTELGIILPGVSAVEGFMVVQDQMLKTVYWHETIRSVMAMFHRFMDVVLENKQERLINFVSKLRTCISEHQALHEVILPYLDGLKPNRKEAVSPLVELHRQPSFTDIYKLIATYTFHDKPTLRRTHLLSIYHQIVQSLTTSATSVPIQWNAVRTLRGCFLNAFKVSETEQRFEIIVDVPWGKAANRIVKVRGNNGRPDYPITEVSHLSNTIFNQPTAFAAPIRVFISPRLFAKHENQIDSIRDTAEMMFYGQEPPQDHD